MTYGRSLCTNWAVAIVGAPRVDGGPHVSIVHELAHMIGAGHPDNLSDCSNTFMSYCNIEQYPNGGVGARFTQTTQDEINHWFNTTYKIRHNCGGVFL